MTYGAVLFIVFFGLTPALALAFGITALILDRKHKVGDLTYVEFSRHLSNTIEQFECSEKTMEKMLKELKKINRGQHGR